jgi:hypothetical protein
MRETVSIGANTMGAGGGYREAGETAQDKQIDWSRLEWCP